MNIFQDMQWCSPGCCRDKFSAVRLQNSDLSSALDTYVCSYTNPCTIFSVIFVLLLPFQEIDEFGPHMNEHNRLAGACSTQVNSIAR